jgi:hypothetical protein
MAALWTIWILAGLAVLCGGMALALRIGSSRQVRAGAAMREQLLARASAPGTGRVRAADFRYLPAPVARYFRHVLVDNQPMIRVARYRQRGELRTGIDSARWMPFDAEQVVAPPAHGFLWDAHVGLTGPLHLLVRDAYLNGYGSGQVYAQSALAVDGQGGNMEMNAGALQRYLAEGPWYPTALLPAAGVRWTAIDDTRALATLSDAGITVSLEFRFNSEGEIVGVYTPGRWRTVGGGYVLTPWEGRFDSYQQIAGMRVPTGGEVGWIDGERWQAVWKGQIRDIAFEFFPEPPSLQGQAKGET